MIELVRIGFVLMNSEVYIELSYICPIYSFFLWNIGRKLLFLFVLFFFPLLPVSH